VVVPARWMTSRDPPMGGGLLDSTLIKRILDFRLVTAQQQRWQEIIEDVPKEYVKAFF
jgi:hypothetical protein